MLELKNKGNIFPQIKLILIFWNRIVQPFMNLCVFKSQWRSNNYPASHYGDDHMVFEDKNCDERGQLYWSHTNKGSLSGAT